MLVKDLDSYVYDKVVLYKNKPDYEGEWINLYKGYLKDADENFLNLTVKTIGAKRTGILDIRVE